MVVSINFMNFSINISILVAVCSIGWWEAAGDISSLKVEPARFNIGTLAKLTFLESFKLSNKDLPAV